ncbi:MAG: ATP-binding protein [Candidatus Nanopelagicales bacterium]
MPTAVLTVPAAPEQARTARLVAGAAARRAGVDEDLLEDVRLAVAEAVARAVLRSVASDGTDTGLTVAVALTDSDDRFEIAVADQAGPAEDEDEDELALTVMQALAPESRTEDNADGGRTIVLTWPVLD